MERFYGKDHSVSLTNEDAEYCIRVWRELANERAVGDMQHALGRWLDERLGRRSQGHRAFRIAPAPEAISDAATLDFFADIISAHVHMVATSHEKLSGKRLSLPQRAAWLGRLLDLHAFVNQARGEHVDFQAPEVPEHFATDVNLRRMWARFVEASRMENHVFPDDPRYPNPEGMLAYLDEILALAEADGREQRREFPFPKVLWEREILLEKLGRYDEMAATMRRAAALEDEAFQKQTEAYIASVSA